MPILKPKKIIPVRPEEFTENDILESYEIEKLVIPVELIACPGTDKEWFDYNPLYEQLRSASTEYEKKSNTRDVAVLELLSATGAGVSGICMLTSETVNMLDHTVSLYGKGSKERIFRIENPNVQKAIKNYHRLFEHEISACGYIFVNKLHTRLTEHSVRPIINMRRL